MGRTVLFTSLGDLDRHDTGQWHPERPARLAATLLPLDSPTVRQTVVQFEPRQATMDELSAAHDREYLERVEQFVGRGGGALDADTQLSAGSWDTALWAAGSGLEAISRLDAGEAEAAFVSVRPPGHHANASQAMGFCFVNNIAVTAATLADRGERVAIIDWDVHHGNGTQDIFWDDPRVLFASLHEHPQYPGTGRASEVGGSAAVGSIVNVPLPSGSTGDLAMVGFDTIIAPAVEAFEPTWILVSAGYDAHERDPLAGLRWTAGDYAELTSRVRSLAPATGRLLFFLEGGYDLDALSESVGATLGRLTDSKYDHEPPSPRGAGPSDLAATIRLRQQALPE